MTDKATSAAATPRPWEVGALDGNNQRIVRSAHIEICTCWHHSVTSIEWEMEASAALIVQAVNSHDELVAACKRMAADCRRCDGTGRAPDEDGRERAADARMDCLDCRPARAALARVGSR